MRIGVRPIYKAPLISTFNAFLHASLKNIFKFTCFVQAGKAEGYIYKNKRIFRGIYKNSIRKFTFIF